MKPMNTYQRILVPAAAAALLAGGGALAAPASATAAAPRTPVAHVTHATPTTVYVYATDVHLREWPNTQSVILATVSHIHLSDWCQTDKNTTPVADPSGGTNPWWSKVTLTTGSDDAWVSNVFLQGGRKIAGVPDC
ncbi:peptidase M23 [Streptomyces sp. RB6PN25]|uniref:Peptidase M23 n=1 Tax=Streptomyces humicola TaxID=2953240 RepID=A0ABT1PYS3_9ACTN|nr:peptidase M23 [Streptomyces humicola]MCQ4082826.1 peptidase M23 [Streptomyces humicola]